jgi:hypothetical protein
VRGGHVVVDLKDGKLAFDIDAPANPASPPVIEVSPDEGKDSTETALVE